MLSLQTLQSLGTYAYLNYGLISILLVMWILSWFQKLENTSQVAVQLYSPQHPLVGIDEVFLWRMAVGTILCSSFWYAWSVREEAIEQDKILKDASFYYVNVEEGYSGIVDINTTSAVLFVVIASGFLIMMYKFMSYWFIKLLVVLFCIGEMEYCPSMLVASAVYAAQSTLKKTPLWNETLKVHTGYTEAQLIECAKELVSFHSAAPEHTLGVVYRKYSSS